MNNFIAEKIATPSYNSFVLHAGHEHSETLILLHGSGPGANAASNWSKVMDEFSKDYRVIAIDLLGFGDTDLPEDVNLTFWAWTTERVKQILEIMDYFNVATATLVGNSMGGIISLNAVMYDSTRFNKLILMGSGGGKVTSGPSPEIARMTRFFNDPTIQSFRNLIQWFMYDDKNFGGDLDEIVEKRYAIIMRPEIRALYPKLFPTMPNETAIPPSALRRIQQPVLLIHGYEDAFVSYESSLSLASHLPNAELTLIKGCGHWVQIEKRERFVELTRNFMQSNVAVIH